MVGRPLGRKEEALNQGETYGNASVPKITHTRIRFGPVISSQLALRLINRSHSLHSE